MKKVIILIAIIALYLTSSAQDEWELLHPYPTLSDLKDVQFISEQEGWAVGYNGIIIYTDNGGETWDIQHDDISELFWNVYFIDDHEGWVVGRSSIYHTTDKGNTWQKQTRPSVMGDLTDVYFINHDTGWIVGTHKIVLKTTDGGDNWIKIMNSISTENSFHSVCFVDELNGCAVGAINFCDNGFVMTTRDGGLTWLDTSPVDAGGFQKVIFTDSLTGWICGYGNELQKTEDGGKTWIMNSTHQYGGSYSDILFFDDNDGILLAVNSIQLTFDAGETWDSVVYNWQYSYQDAITSWGDHNAVTVGANGSVLKTLDGGNNWEVLSSEMSSTINKIGFFNSNDGYALTTNWGGNDVISTKDGGYTWTIDTLIENGPFYNMQIEGESFYLLNNSSQLMKSVNAGVDWELFNVSDSSSGYNDMFFVNNNTGYLCGSDGLFVKTEDGGSTWVDKPLYGNYNLNTLFFINENVGWMFDTQARVVLRTTNGGDDWDWTFIGDFFNYQPRSIFFVDEHLGYITSTEGILFKTYDGGRTWEEFSFISGNGHSQIYFVNEIEGWYSISSRVYHTFDGGLSWVNDQSLGSSLNTMFFLNNEQGWLGGQDGIVATTNFTVNINEFGEIIPSATVFPNPAKDDIEIKLHDKSDKIKDIKVFNMQGNKVMHFTDLSEHNTFAINVSKLFNGTYVVQITSEKSENIIKFIAQ
jgi:photosystem II stability/assembly factor-like uncharacterized protein